LKQRGGFSVRRGRSVKSGLRASGSFSSRDWSGHARLSSGAPPGITGVLSTSTASDLAAYGLPGAVLELTPRIVGAVLNEPYLSINRHHCHLASEGRRIVRG